MQFRDILRRNSMAQANLQADTTNIENGFALTILNQCSKLGVTVCTKRRLRLIPYGSRMESYGARFTKFYSV